MGKSTSATYTSPNAATWHTADTDVYSRLDSFTGFLQDLDVHDHRTGKGLGAGRITSTAIAATANTGECVVITGGLKITDGTTQQQLLDVTQNGVTAYKALGLTGASAASRYAGGTASGAPGSGTFAVGDYIVDQTGTFWVCTGAGTPGTWQRPAARSILPFNAVVSMTAGNTYYIGVGTSVASGSEANVGIVMPVAGVLSALYVAMPGSPGASQTYTVTVRQNSANTSLAVSIANSGTTSNDSSHTVTVAAGDVIDIGVVCSAGAATVGGFRGSVVLVC